MTNSDHDDTPDPSTASHVHPRLRPTQALIHDAVDATTWLIEEGHESTARAVVGVIDAAAPQLRQPVQAVDTARRVLTGGVLASVRAVNRTVQVVSGVALDLAQLNPPPPPVVPMRSDALTTLGGSLDQVVGALNGAVGDHLSQAHNGLDLGMRLRHGDTWLRLSRDSLREDMPDAKGRLVVLVHGLATTELCWSLDAEQELGDASRHYGAMLEQDLGLSSVYVRYNTGCSVAHSGQCLAAALDALVAAWPVPVQSLVLVGHSMGGLVVRAATHAATTLEQTWPRLLTHIVFLGTPHQGAPLARLGQTAADVLQRVDLPATRILGKILAHRSEGVQDLRQREPDAVGPLLDHIQYLFVAGALTTDPQHFSSELVGDLLVPLSSAEGPPGEDPPGEAPSSSNVQVRRFGDLPHYRLQANADVYRAIVDHLGDDARSRISPLDPG
ncbi:MAG: hypothetical protein GXP62_17620 [Oligoflexia bacterium]|nr:hypothetical protein [Oligoflexia bacterium]